MHFDVVLMNPPYQHGLCDKFFSKALDFADMVVTIQPTGWLIAKKQNKNIVSKLDNAYCEFTILNPHVFDAWFLNNVSINYIDYTKPKEIKLYDEICNAKHTYNNVNEITKVSLDKYLSEFNSIIKPHYDADNLFNHTITTYNTDIQDIIINDYPVIRYAGIRGHLLDKCGNLNADFYTIISNNEKEQRNKVLITGKQLPHIKATHIIVLKDSAEQLGLFNYIKTDFVRACLMICKTNQHLDSGEMKFVPWFDFSNKVFSKSPKEIDDYLFSKYNISDDIRKHIEEILPDYYNIRHD